MPAFELEQVDGGDPLDLPYGNTVLGRGPFLAVSDKRVSRNHAVLENQDGQLRLKPIHTNPCFIQTSLEASPQPLEKDQWHCLSEGSMFSLLPGKYIYKVHAVTKEGTPRNSQGCEVETGKDTDVEDTSKPPQPSEETLAYTPRAGSGPSLTPCSQVVGEAPVSRTVASAPDTPQRKRLLPAWMMVVTPTALKSLPATAAAKRTPARATPNPARPKRAARREQARARLPLSDDDEEEEEVEQSEVVRMPRKRARRLAGDPDESQDQAHAPHLSPERSPEVRVGEEAAVVDTEEREEEEVKGRGRKKAEVPPRSGTGGSPPAMEEPRNSQANEQPSQNGRQRTKVADPGDGSKSKAQQRTPCPYGTSCYRKNPIHFRECSHPGDDDHEEECSNEDDCDGGDDRPECPYGTDCYRKNPLHKKQYKHTTPPAKMSVPGSAEDDDDEDQYEDSFINDESEEEEADEGSDYVPESDDGGKEDVKQLQKEAKAFLRRKRK
ncbi:aprataxin and PNK-like factor isoform X2 [Brachyhypopomus gauderio]|uniref:aprataxin and PNK-like factor isoform X2 n=1 Tax=Brachyhypopomus gauderio TaxID=698409 RepID=UPI00404295BA